MKLELFINGRHYNTLDIAPEDFRHGNQFFYRVEANQESIDAYILKMKAMFFKQLCKCDSFEIILVLQSKLNFLTKNETENETKNGTEHSNGIREITTRGQVL